MSESSKNENVTKDILSSWIHEKEIDLKGENINELIENGTKEWSIGDDYILKMSWNEEDIKNNIYISKLLANEGIPVQEIISTLDGNEYLKINNKYYALFTKIKGNGMQDYYEGNYVARGYYLGQCLGKLHRGLKNITGKLKKDEKLYDNYMMDEINGWVKEEIDQYMECCELAERDKENFNTIYKNILSNFEEVYKQLPRQIIHKDFHGNNIVFKDGKLSGYIDFDLSEINARLFDLCYLCTGALASGFDDEVSKKKWVGFARKVILGYKTIIEMTPVEEDSIKDMFYMIQLIMAAYFVKNNYNYIADINIQMINYIDEVW